jgi:hypothetical protein
MRCHPVESRWVNVRHIFPRRQPVASSNRVMWVGVDVRNRWAKRITPVPTTTRAAVTPASRQPNRPLVRKQNHRPAAAKSETAAPMLAPANGSPAKRATATTSANPHPGDSRKATYNDAPISSPTNTFGRPKNRPPSSCEPPRNGVRAAVHPIAASTRKNRRTATPMAAGGSIASRRASGAKARVPTAVTPITNGTTVAYDNVGRCPAASRATAMAGTDMPTQAPTRASACGTRRRIAISVIPNRPPTTTYRAAAVWTGTVIRRIARYRSCSSNGGGSSTTRSGSPSRSLGTARPRNSKIVGRTSRSVTTPVRRVVSDASVLGAPSSAKRTAGAPRPMTSGWTRSLAASIAGDDVVEATNTITSSEVVARTSRLISIPTPDRPPKSRGSSHRHATWHDRGREASRVGSPPWRLISAAPPTPASARTSETPSRSSNEAAGTRKTNARGSHGAITSASTRWVNGGRNRRESVAPAPIDSRAKTRVTRAPE